MRIHFIASLVEAKRCHGGLFSFFHSLRLNFLAQLPIHVHVFIDVLVQQVLLTIHA